MSVGIYDEIQELKQLIVSFLTRLANTKKAVV